MSLCSLALGAALAISQPVSATSSDQAVLTTAGGSISSEPFFADLVDRARGLKAVVDHWVETGSAADVGLHNSVDFAAFKDEAAILAQLDMQGHLTLKTRGTDGDLTCILRGIAEDMPKKIEAVETALDEAGRKVALEELAYLLNDNVEVIQAPPITQ